MRAAERDAGAPPPGTWGTQPLHVGMPRGKTIVTMRYTISDVDLSPFMNSVFILRRDLRDARRTQAAVEATRDLRVAGVATALADARPTVAAADVLLADLHLADGSALTLVQELRAIKTASGRPRVLLVAQPHDDAEVFAALRAGADSLVRVAEAGAEPAPVIRRVLRGESAISPAIARQLLAFFGESGAISLATPVNERALDWSTDAQNPLRLSRAERHMLALFAQTVGIGPIAARLGLSVESIGRRTANVYRKLQWELRSGSLSLQAA